ncbi:MAG TPA: gamma-glutamylcyclotransferase family protein [Solirubrobacterales bacterium]|nr:gamma-glutamylcyclotransferase family protein [Solirubrobacterales bacterium]
MTAPLVFAYGSLVSRTSVVQTLGEPVEVIAEARLRGWRRRWSTVRNNRASEKSFAPAGGGNPFRYCLGLNIEPGPGAPGPNGVLLRITGAQLERLDLRELRYDRVDVTDAVDGAGPTGSGVIAYAAKPRHHGPSPPPGAVILGSYVRAVESAFEQLGRRALEVYRATTQPHPVDVVEGVLVDFDAPPGNPRAW